MTQSMHFLLIVHMSTFNVSSYVTKKVQRISFNQTKYQFKIISKTKNCALVPQKAPSHLPHVVTYNVEANGVAPLKKVCGAFVPIAPNSTKLPELQLDLIIGTKICSSKLLEHAQSLSKMVRAGSRHARTPIQNV